MDSNINFYEIQITKTRMLYTTIDSYVIWSHLTEQIIKVKKLHKLRYIKFQYFYAMIWYSESIHLHLFMWNDDKEKKNIRIHKNKIKKIKT